MLSNAQQTPAGVTHNLKVVGSNPTPATKNYFNNKYIAWGIFIPQAILRFTSTPHQHRNRKTAFAGVHVHWPALARIRGRAALNSAKMPFGQL
jgi:hypothetical protein